MMMTLLFNVFIGLHYCTTTLTFFFSDAVRKGEPFHLLHSDITLRSPPKSVPNNLPSLVFASMFSYGPTNPWTPLNTSFSGPLKFNRPVKRFVLRLRINVQSEAFSRGN